jgi:hypothetical protein
VDILAILEGIISSVPEAIQLYHKVAPLISQRADISDADIASVNALVPEAHTAVALAHSAIATLTQVHAE